MNHLALLLVALATQTSTIQQLPPWAYHSTITQEQRTKAFDKILKMLQVAGRTDKEAQEAADLLKNRAYVVEPLGEDASGSDAVRFIRVPPHRGKQTFDVMPLFKVDVKASDSVKQLYKNSLRFPAGEDTDAPMVYLITERIQSRKSLDTAAEAIIFQAHQEDPKVKLPHPTVQMR